MLTHEIFNNIFTDKIAINPYSCLSAQSKVNERNREYLDIELNTVTSMFDYIRSDNFYDKIDNRTIEYILRVFGTIAWFYGDDKTPQIGACYSGGMLDQNGVGLTCSISQLNGKGFKRINGVDCVLGFNNNTRTGEQILLRFADEFSECNLSQDCNLKYSRLYPIFVAKNSKIKTAIEQLLKKMFIGEPTAIADESLTVNGTKPVEPIQLTDNNAIQKMQYLDTHYANLQRRFYTLYGQPLSDGTKLAQQTVEEVSSNVSSSFTIPFNNYMLRKEMCKKVSKFFGHTIDVKFSKCWEVEIQKWQALADEKEEIDKGVEK